jgi:hypothetical protein
MDVGQGPNWGCSAKGKKKSNRLRQEGHVSRMKMERNSYEILIGIPERNRPLRRHWCRWKLANTKTYLMK